MKLLNSGDILETIEMLTTEHLDVRTVTMGISLWTASTRTGAKPARRFTTKSPRAPRAWCRRSSASRPSTVSPS